MNLINSVGYEDESILDKARQIAEQLNFALDKDACPCLFVTAEKLGLKMPNFSLLFADFSASAWNKRKAEGKKQGLVRACKPTKGLKIIDATAGWGRDAAVLASFGADVLMLERHPVMAALLADALSLRDDSDKQQMHLRLEPTDAYIYLKNLSKEEYPDLIYIDPMHPERDKSALVKKDMQALQQMIGADKDALELITLASTRVKQRVIVKWPQKVKSLLPANASIEGKTVRFDIYLPKVQGK
jgi:16S rRNA (guanine1516-N2)-methyltransferase